MAFNQNRSSLNRRYQNVQCRHQFIEFTPCAVSSGLRQKMLNFLQSSVLIISKVASASAKLRFRF